MANKIRELRQEQSLTLPQLSDQLKKYQNLDITSDALSKYERGDREPKLETWKRLASFFNVSVQYLMTGELPTLVEKERWVTNLFSYVYSFSEIGSSRSSDDVLNSLPLLDAELNTQADSGALDFDKYDFSYSLDRYMKNYYPKEFKKFEDDVNDLFEDNNGEYMEKELIFLWSSLFSKVSKKLTLALNKKQPITSSNWYNNTTILLATQYLENINQQKSRSEYDPKLAKLDNEVFDNVNVPILNAKVALSEYAKSNDISEKEEALKLIDEALKGLSEYRKKVSEFRSFTDEQ